MHIHCMRISPSYITPVITRMLLERQYVANVSARLRHYKLFESRTEEEVREGLNIYRSHARRIIHARPTGMVLFLW